MGFTLSLMLTCDNCGEEEDYGEDTTIEEAVTDLPLGWLENVDDGLQVFGHLCKECVAVISDIEADDGAG